MAASDCAPSSSIVVEELSEAEVREIVDREARQLLNMSGDEFRSRWNSGELADSDNPAVTRIAMLLPDAWENR